MSSHVEKSVRFNPRTKAFAAASQEYRGALAKAERLWRKLQSASVCADPTKEEKVRRALAEIDERLDRARRALLEHTVSVARDPMRTRVKNLGLGVRRRPERTTTAEPGPSSAPSAHKPPEAA